VSRAINLRTDGKDAVIAYRKKSASPKNRWFFYKLTRDMKAYSRPR
jgi:hypothetical protein